MSIATELERIIAAKEAIIQAIINKGVDVPENAKIGELPALIDEIGGGGGDTVVIGGKTYRTTTIGNQIWLAENLDLTWDGLTVGLYNSELTSPAAVYYNNDALTYGWNGARKCGLLYNYYAAAYIETNKSTLIPGWHLPTYDEWMDLVYDESVDAFRPSTQLNASNVSWAPTWGGADTYGFSALPGGFYCAVPEDGFDEMGEKTYFWTATPYGNKIYDFYFDNSDISNEYSDKCYGYSIRLIKDT